MDSQEGRSRRGSTASSPNFGYNTPHRAGTASSLPPYSTSPPSRRGSEEQPVQRAKTPSDLLFSNIARQESRSGSDLGTEKFKSLLEPDDGAAETFQSPDSSPRAKRLSKPLADLPEREAFNDPSSLSSIGSCRSSIAIRSGSNSRPDITSHLDPAVPEIIMESLKGVKMCVSPSPLLLDHATAITDEYP